MLLTTDVWAVSAESESWVQEECHQGNIFCLFSMEHLPENPEDGVPLKNNF